MKTILAAWIAAILLLLLASVVLAGPDEDARAALALSGSKAAKSTSDYYGVLWKQDEEIMFSVRQSNGLNRLYRVKCTNADCFAAVVKLADTEKVVVLAGKDVPVPGRYCDDLAADSVREVMRAKSTCDCTGNPTACTCPTGACGCANCKSPDAPSANQQKQIDALPPGTVYQWRRPDGTLSEPKTKPGAAAPASTPATFRILPVRWSTGPQMCSPGGA